MGLFFISIRCVNMFSAIGEYADDHVFSATEASIHAPRIFSSASWRIEIAWCMQKLQKMKILGIGCQGIIMPNTIQPGEYSMGSDD